MPTTIVYRVVEQEDGSYHCDSLTSDIQVATHGEDEETAVLAFKEGVSLALPEEQALIFVTEEQAKAMEIYSEKEKHGG